MGSHTSLLMFIKYRQPLAVLAFWMKTLVWTVCISVGYFASIMLSYVVYRKLHQEPRFNLVFGCCQNNMFLNRSYEDNKLG